jgi:phosphoglucosamine mutase
MAKKFFGTDGIRGRANVLITPELALKVGQAAGLAFQRGDYRHRVVIGKDTRLSGYMIETAMVAGFTSVGMDVLLLGPVPTPAVAMLTPSMRADLGVMISASHNLFEDNGIKLFGPDGYKLSDDVEREIEALFAADLGPRLAQSRDLGRAKRVESVDARYIEFAKRTLPRNLSLEGLRIVVDCANGAAYKVAPAALWELGAEVFSIGVEPNGFNINQDVGSTSPEALAAKVREMRADIGIALDGDADRIVAIDEKGEIIDGDEMLAACGVSRLKKNTLKNNTVVSTVMSNMGLEVALTRAGGTLIRSKVGDRYVMEAMRKGDHILGGEQSGHLIFRDSSTTGDGILAGLKFLEIMVEDGRRASDLRQTMERLPQLVRNVKVKSKVPLESLKDFQKSLHMAEKKLHGKGRVLVRYSGTESLARVMVEGENRDEIEALANDRCHELTTAIDKVSEKAK